MIPARWLRIVVAAVLCCRAAMLELPAEESSVSVPVEVLKRLKDVDLEAKPAVKKALYGVLSTVKGTPAFVELVRDFKLTNENPALVEFALEHPNEPATVDALKTLLTHGGVSLLETPLASDPRAAEILEPLGKTTDNRMTPLLAPIVTDASRELKFRRDAVRALAQCQDGANKLLQLARDDRLPNEVKLVAANQLNRARWREVRTEAAQLLPLPTAKGDQAIPPIYELVKKTGNADRGAEIFRRPELNCIGCHQVRGEGLDYGPALSEIGTKLAKEALYESILDPSAGIAFGYEAWQFTLKQGDEVLGLVTSDTPNEVIVKIQGGTTQSLKPSEISKREKQKLSIMPTGLQGTLSTQEFVDLIEYLASLKKAGN
jgi:putative heme-binding domain-containing protein